MMHTIFDHINTKLLITPGFKSGIGIIWLIALLFVSSCSTGIESTKTITMSRAELRNTRPQPEDEFIAALAPIPVSTWHSGRRFLIADNRASAVLGVNGRRPDPDDDSLVGKIITFQSIRDFTNIADEPELELIFTNGDDTYSYRTGKTPQTALSAITQLDIPMLIDLELVARADSLLRDRKVWTRSMLWYNDKEEHFRGLKFVPVTITKVMAGNMVSPLHIYFKDAEGHNGSMYMNVENGSNSSRTFGRLFSLTDPKEKYPAIKPGIWESIQRGTVRNGMTKDECRLALGTPDEVDSGVTWDQVMDVWKYSDGTYLRFQDGLLVSFRR